MFKSNKHRGKRVNGITDSLLLRGLIFCKDCGHTIGFRGSKQNTIKHGEVVRIYGNCNYWAKRKHQDVCTPHNVKYSDIEEIVLSNLKAMCKDYLDENNLDNIINNFEIIKLDNLIENINKKIDVIMINLKEILLWKCISELIII